MEQAAQALSLVELLLSKVNTKEEQEVQSNIFHNQMFNSRENITGKIHKNKAKQPVLDKWLNDLTFSGKDNLESIKDELLNCKEFSEAKGIKIIDSHVLFKNDKDFEKLRRIKIEKNKPLAGYIYIKNINLINSFDDVRKYDSDFYITNIMSTQELPSETVSLRNLIINFNSIETYNNEFFFGGKERMKEYLYNCIDKAIENPQQYLETNLSNAFKYECEILGFVSDVELLEKDITIIKYLDKFKVKSKAVKNSIAATLYDKYGSTLAGLTEEELENLIIQNA